MIVFTRFVRVVLLAAGLASLLPAQPLPPPERIALETLDAFRPTAANWRVAGGIDGDPRHEKTLSATAGTGVLVNSPTTETRGHLFTKWEHGDVELDLEFLLPAGSNSGVYLQGRYEVQLLDSWGVRAPTSGDCGGIYERWDDARGKGKEGFEGHAPRANACRAPGLWQQLHIEFLAPRFDAAGNKTRNARFVKVALNGFTIHENVEVTGPTRSAAFDTEAPLGPLMIQGDHGPVAIRGLAVRRYDAEPIRTEELRYKLYAGEFKSIGEYDSATPKSEGEPARFAQSAVEKSGKFALVFTGRLIAPREGQYGFAVETGGVARLVIDDRTVVVPLDRGGQPGTITLAKGPHAFRLDFIHTSASAPRLEVLVAGPGVAPQTLTRERGSETRFLTPAPNRGRPLLVQPKDRVLLQRGFVPFDPRKRLYAASVGTPQGVHYAYDFETAAILRVWRGRFLDTSEMWVNRGESQLAKPAGPALTLDAKPAVALIEYAQNGDWPTEPEPLWSSQGYQLEANGQPVFKAMLADIAVRDRIAPRDDGKGLVRTTEFSGALPSWSAWMLLADAATITPQPDGRGWIVGDREWYLDWPADATVGAVVRSVNGRQQLAVPITKATLEKPVRYEIVW